MGQLFKNRSSEGFSRKRRHQLLFEHLEHRTLLSVNVAPINHVPEVVTTAEDTPVVFSTEAERAVSIADEDAGTGELQVTLTATHGTVTLSGTEGLTFAEGAGDGTEDATMTFTGTLEAINTALDGMQFIPEADFNGSGAELRIETNDQGNTGEGGPLSDTDTIAITVEAVNDPPVNQVPGAQSTEEDTELVFSEANGNLVAISDVDASTGELRVTLAAAHGTITLDGIEGLMFVEGGGDGTEDATMTFTGTLEAINAALDGMRFLPEASYVGADAALHIETNDQGNTGEGGPLSDTDTITITVEAVNDPPVNQVPGDQSTAEDTELVFSEANGNLVAIGDVDAGNGPLEVTLTATHGTITLSRTEGLTFAEDGGDGTGDATMTFTGTLEAINAALDGMRFLPEANYVGTDAELRIETNDQGNTGEGGPLTDTDTIAITVEAVNDPPVNQVPGPQLIAEDSELVFSTAAGIPISVSDVDVGSGPLQVTLTAAHGTVTLRQTTGLTFVQGDGTSDSGMTFTGTVEAINAALDGLKFKLEANYAGSGAKLQITTSDQGSAGSGGAQTDTDEVAITVEAINDAPTNQVPNGLTMKENAKLVLSGSSQISVADVDAGDGEVRITLKVSHGALTLKTTSGLTFTSGDGSGDAEMVFKGKIADINNALAGMEYQPPTGFFGQATLSITTDDQGHSGAGGSKQALDTTRITVQALNRAPVLNTNADPRLKPIDQDPASANNPGTLVSELIASVGTGVDLITDSDSGAKEGIAITAVDTAHGKWQYSINGGSTWTDISGVSNTAALLLRTVDKIRFVPNADFNGEIDPAITFRAWDQTSGTQGTKVDTSTNGNTTAFSTATETASIAVGNVSFAGRVFIDSNNNGSFDSGEDPLPFVQITLTGTDKKGRAVSRTALTGADGTFRFDHLPAGTYTLAEDQPAGYADGKDRREVGNARQTASANDRFASISASPDQELAGYHFAELGLAPKFLSKRLLISTAPRPETQAFKTKVVEIRARAEEMAGRPELADQIRLAQETAGATFAAASTLAEAAATGSSADEDALLAALAAMEQEEASKEKQAVDAALGEDDSWYDPNWP